ncbi:hypothetical protein DICPUDRAFT_32378 [Dictyostelium purpureum]|uniref:Ras guanine nucleotide exchange factor n=1 Tax=Dictyostelium purpureum TaxID=5786 RepID=F0ZIV9_DICPU|nr:uncharacterized protein DICPUDRAFT_32378 [Dictyostelium purpureum]EGC36093.1 hypothetical protein DICPUDRAFT_32378 [Dictyostelium purpureum]|eukprot:XP_003287350.1 hypothetical protein DICPUDRAFT_32378 [Dictyostelium purpureum]
MWQKSSLQKTMTNESHYNPYGQTTSSPSTATNNYSNRVLPNKISASSTSTSSLPVNGIPNRIIVNSGGSNSLPSSPVSSPMNPFSPGGSPSGGKQNRRRGVTVAVGSEQFENRRKILLGNSRPLRRRANSMEVLNSWDYIPFQKKPLDHEQGQVDQYIHNEASLENQYESYLIDQLNSIIALTDYNSSETTSSLSSSSSRTGSFIDSSSGGTPSRPPSQPPPLPPMNHPNNPSQSSSVQGGGVPISQLNNSSDNLKPGSQPPPSPRTYSTGNQSPPVPPRPTSRSLGFSNDFSISLSSSLSSSQLVSGTLSSSSDSVDNSKSSNNNNNKSRSTSTSSTTGPQPTNKIVYENNDENKFVVVSGPKDQLVEYLCNKNKLDFSYVNSFILSFRYFISPEELFDYLIVKYETKVQTTSSIKVSKQFEEIQDRIKQNVIIIFSVWVDCNFSDFEEDLGLYKRLMKLVESSPNSVFLRDAIDRQRVSKIPILEIYEKLKDELLLSLEPRGSSSNYSLSNSGDIKNIKNSFFSMSTMMEWLMNHLQIGNATASAILKKLFKLKVIGSLGGYTNQSSNSNSKSSKEELFFFVNTTINSINKEIYSRSFMDYHPQDIAKQLTLLEFKLFQDIRMKELYHKSWTISKSKFENSPTIMALITMSNKIANWVATEVVTTPHPKKRVEVLKRFISVAEHCKKINNFNTLMEIISGLSNSAVSRLKETWKSLPTRYTNSFNSLQNFLKTDENWKTYRQALKTKETPSLPYLGLFLQDINFIEDGNSNYLDNDYVNFKKMNLLTSVFSEVQFYQKYPYYSFSTHKNIQTYLEKDIVILPDKELYAFSKFVESPTNPLNKLSKFMKNSNILI